MRSMKKTTYNYILWAKKWEDERHLTANVTEVSWLQKRSEGAAFPLSLTQANFTDSSREAP